MKKWRNGDVVFNVTHAALERGAVLVVRNYFGSHSDVGSIKYVYKSLREAAEMVQVGWNVHVIAIIDKIVKVPILLN